MATKINNLDDTIDVRDVIARVEELREEREEFVIGSPDAEETPDPAGWTLENPEDAAELETLESILSSICGYGGDEQWEGEWYPLTLIRYSHFKTAMDELLEDIGDLPKDWPSYLIISVDYVALQQDYGTVEFDGQSYFYR